MMNKLDIVKVRASNFLSIGPTIEFDFEKHTGLNYVYGQNNDVKVERDGDPATIRNACGKSNLIECIVFAIFNRLIRNVNKSSIPNRRYKKNCSVELWLRANDKHYYIKNTISPSSYELWESDDETMEDLSNATNISKGSPKETLAYVRHNIIKSSYKIFMNTNILSVTDHDSLYTMSKNETRMLTEQLFSVTMLGDIYNDVKSEANKIENMVLQAQQHISSIENRIVTLESHHKNFEIEKLAKIKKLFNEILVKEENIRSIEKTSNKDELSTRRRELEEAQQTLTIEERACRDELSAFNAFVEARKSIIMKNKALLDTYKIAFDVVCDECYGKLHKTLDIDIVSLQQGIDKAQNEICTTMPQIEDTKNIINEMLVELKNIRLSLMSNAEEMSRIYRQENFLTSLRSEVFSLENAMVVENDRVSEFSSLVELENREMIKIVERLTSYEDRLRYLDALKIIYSEQGVKNFIISPLMMTLNNMIQENLVKMGSEYTVIIDSMFNFKFITVSGECEYGNFSAGERRRIDIATIFALRELLMMKGLLICNILVCDEILDVSIDDYCMSVLLDQLKDISKTKNVFLVSHREVNADLDIFDNVIRIDKTHGCTHIGIDTAIV